jgi:hypothetical protein
MLMAKVLPSDAQPRAQAVLSTSPIVELRDLRVEQQDAVLTLVGKVSSFYHKQLAQEVVWAVCKDLDVDLVNLIQVQESDRFTE